MVINSGGSGVGFSIAQGNPHTCLTFSFISVRDVIMLFRPIRGGVGRDQGEGGTNCKPRANNRLFGVKRGFLVDAFDADTLSMPKLTYPARFISISCLHFPGEPTWKSFHGSSGFRRTFWLSGPTGRRRGARGG